MEQPSTIFQLSLQQESLWEREKKQDTPKAISQIAWRIELGNVSDLRAAFESVCCCVEQLRVVIEHAPGEKSPRQILTDSVRCEYHCPHDDNYTSDSEARQILLKTRAEAEFKGRAIAGHLRLDSGWLIHLTIPGLIGDVNSAIWLLDCWVRQLQTKSNPFSYDGLQYIDYSEWQKNNVRRFNSTRENLNLNEALPIEDFSGESSNNSAQYHFTSQEVSRALLQNPNFSSEALLFASWYNLMHKLSSAPVCYNCSGRDISDLQHIFGPVEKDVSFPTAADSPLAGVADAEKFLAVCKEAIQHFGGELDWFPPSAGHTFTYLDLRRYTSLTDAFPFEFVRQSCTTGLQFTCLRANAGFEFILHYDPVRFQLQTVQQLATSFESIVVSYAIHRSGEFILKPLKAELKIIESCLSNSAHGITSSEGTILTRLKNAVNTFPEKAAIICSGDHITYKVLWERSSRLGKLLIDEFDIKCGCVVAVDLPRSIEMVVSIVAILKTGAAYLVLDQRWPEKRKDFLLADSKAKLRIDADFLSRALIDEVGADFEIETTRENLEANAYLIYTSGTTGDPKGVFIRHESLVGYTDWVTKYFGIQTTDRTLLFSSLAYDLPYTSFWPAISIGATLYLHADEPYLNAEALVYDLEIHDITYIKLTPTHFSMIIAALRSSGKTLPGLRLVILGGEKLNKHDIDYFWTKHPAAKFVNHYGPTEATVGCLALSFDFRNRKFLEFGNIIGKPIADNTIYILNGNDICAVGEWGEICVSGKSVAKGYLNRPDLSAEKFQKNPFTSSGKFYRTGDRGRLLHNGVVQFGGRTDHQLKINGVRIEPAEIELQLTAIADVERAIVTAFEYNGITKLVAFIQTNAQLDDVKIKASLKERLPVQYIPDDIIIISEIPTKGHGKIDLAQLHDVANKRWEQSSVGRKSFDDARAILEQVWQEVLHVGPSSFDVNFFAAGGDSIKAIRMIALLGQRGVELDINVLFREQSIKNIYPHLAVKQTQSIQDVVTGTYELTPIQRRLFLQPIEHKAFVQAVSLNLNRQIGRDVLDRVVTALIIHHDGLRLQIDNVKLSGRIAEPGERSYFLKEWDFQSIESFQKSYSSVVTELKSRIDLANGPLVSIGLCQHSFSTICFVVHHLVVDAISWRILVEDFLLLLSEGSAVLPAKTDSYALWARYLSNYRRNTVWKDEINYWQSVQTKAKRYFTKEMLLTGQHEKQILQFNLSKETTTLLSTHCNSSFNTETSDLLITALYLALSKADASDEMYVCLEGHGRERLNGKIDVTRTVGWFSTLFPFHFTSHRQLDMTSQIIAVKEAIRKLPSKGIGYGLLKYSPNPVLKDDNEPEIRFNYFGEIRGLDNDGELHVSDIATYSDSELSAFPCDIIAKIVQGQLSVQVIYEVSVVPASFAEDFIRDFQFFLLEVVQVCSTHTEVIKTPSDFDYKDLSMSELRSLFD